MVEPKTKQAISILIDRNVLEWFNDQGKGYQSLMNSVLKSYVEHQNRVSSVVSAVLIENICTAITIRQLMAAAFGGVFQG